MSNWALGCKLLFFSFERTCPAKVNILVGQKKTVDYTKKAKSKKKTTATCGLKIYREDITRWREDVNFMFEWQEQYLTSELSERVIYCSCHENIKFISSGQRVMFFLLYGD